MSTQTDSFYNKFSTLYPLVDVFLKPQKRVLFNEVNDLAPGRLLEIGVGNGSHLHWYKKHEVVGIDTSAAMLLLARRRGFNNIELLKMDGSQLLFKNEEFDCVVLSHVIAVVDDAEQLMQEVYRVLKPKGRVLILNHFTPQNWLGYTDKAFHLVSKLLHFRSVFYMEGLDTIKRFDLLKQRDLGFASYFKLLIYQKK